MHVTIYHYVVRDGVVVTRKLVAFLIVAHIVVDASGKSNDGIKRNGLI